MQSLAQTASFAAGQLFSSGAVIGCTEVTRDLEENTGNDASLFTILGAGEAINVLVVLCLSSLQRGEGFKERERTGFKN